MHFFLFLVSYLFFPTVFTILIYAFPLAGFSFLVHKVLLEIDRQKIKRVEEDDRRKKFAKSRRSFKSAYGDRRQLIRRNTIKRSDDDTTTNVGDKDDFFSKTLNDLLFEGKPKEIAEVNVDSIVGRGSCSSSNDHSQPLRPEIYGNIDGNHKDELEGQGLDISDEEDDEPHNKAVRWTEDDQKNEMDLGLSEAERNKRLESLMERRKSRKNLGFQEGGEMGNKNNVQVSAIKTTRINPFLEDNSCGKKSPGSAPSSFLTIHNPFDIPYDPQEEKPDLTGDNFHEEFTVGHQKEQIYCRHQSFSLGAFSHPEITHDKHDIAFYKDLSTKQNSVIGLGTSTIDNIGDYKHINQDSLISKDSSSSNHPKEQDESPERLVGVLHEEDGTERKTDEADVALHVSNAIESDLLRKADSTMLDERKADIVFFYGTHKRVGHAPSSSGVSDLQVEVSDEGSAPTLDELDIEKAKESGLNSSNQSEADVEIVREGAEKIVNPSFDIQTEGHNVAQERNHEIISSNLASTNQSTADKQRVSEMENHPSPINSDTLQNNHVDAFRASQSSVAGAAVPDGLTEVAVGQAPVTSSSPKSVLQREFSTDPASPHNFFSEDPNHRQS